VDDHEDDDRNNNKQNKTKKKRCHNKYYHVSLSRTFYLQAANLEAFRRALARHVATLPPFCLTLGDASQLQLLHNDENTRSFAVWPIIGGGNSQQPQSPPHPMLPPLVRRVDAALALYGQPPYYDPPIFHVSLASFVPAVSERVVQRLVVSSRRRSRRNDHPTSTSAAAKARPQQDSATAASPCSPGANERKRARDETSVATSSSSSDDDEDDGSTATHQFFVAEIHCTFGTTQHYTIGLQQSATAPR